MFDIDTTWQYLRRVLGLENKISSQNTNTLPEDSPPTIAPTMSRTEETPALHREEELKRDLCYAICECYPNIQKLKVIIIPNKIYIGNGKYGSKYCLSVSWENGVIECRIDPIINCVITDYLDSAQGQVTRTMFIIHTQRLFTEKVILKVSQKYADCIAQNLPLNIHNIRCFKVGGVPIFDLARGELRLLEEVN